MQVVKNCAKLDKEYNKILVGLGNFDGVHLGHQKLIREMVKQARQQQVKSAVLTFVPHPAKVLFPEQQMQNILNEEAKETLIAQLGVDLLIKLDFDLNLAHTTPEDFIKQILVEKLNIGGVYVGYNYNFGCGGKGNPATLKALGKIFGYKVQIIPPVVIAGEVVSSSLIRKMLIEGALDKAKQYLGYAPFVAGEVIPGDRRGRKMGVPTANIDTPQGLLLPAAGVYSVDVLVGEQVYRGVANVGFRPTFKQKASSPKVLEVHLLDYSGNLYGYRVRVVFKQYLRPELEFYTQEALQKQIGRDIELASRHGGKINQGSKKKRRN